MSTRCTDTRRLIVDTEIQDAALWRLADWTPEEIEAASAPLASLLSTCRELDASHRSVAKVLPNLQRPGDRRDPWIALAALVCLWAQAQGDKALFYRAGFEVLASYKQAMRGRQTPERDELDKLLTEYLTRHPATTADALYSHCQSLAPLRWVVQDASDDCLTYRASPAGKLKPVSRHAFDMRVCRLRKALDATPSTKQNTSINIFRWPDMQPAAVMRAA